MSEPTPADSVRLRLREEMLRRGLSQRDLAHQLQWSQGRLAKVLTGRTDLRYNDMVAVCQMIGLSIVEAVRDHGLEFCAEMTPTELRVLERFRQLPHLIPAILLILNVSSPDARRALPATPTPRRHRGRAAKADPKA
jgi:transcriptional regulator with XRE-family HTH domain